MAEQEDFEPEGSAGFPTSREGLTARIAELEAVARGLEPARGERGRVREAAVAYSERFLERIGELKAYEIDKEAARDLRASPIREVPAPVAEVLDLVARCVDAPGLNPASGGHLGYIPGGGLYYSALGDYLADVTNNYAGVRFAGPGAVEMENLVLDWMAELVGYPAGAGGNLASGGSIANLIAVVTAREARELKARDFPRAVVYLSDQTHHCVEKALRVAGMGESLRRRVPLDRRYRMRPDALEAMVAEDRAAGLVPWMVVASAGSTDVGAIDPLEELARVARAEGLWYHVDAAYGGFFLLVEGMAPKFRGLEESDSLVLDPHKGLFLPYGTGAVLVRDRRDLYRAHRQGAAYLQDVEAEEAGAMVSPADLSPELSRNFRGLRLWLPLKLHGLAPFRAGLQEKLLLTRYFHREVAERGFETGPEPELSVSTYRWMPRTGPSDGRDRAADAFNRALLEAVHRDGRVFLSSTLLDGRFTLRMAALAFRTHLDTIRTALEVLEKEAAALEARGD